MKLTDYKILIISKSEVIYSGKHVVVFCKDINDLEELYKNNLFAATVSLLDFADPEAIDAHNLAMVFGNGAYLGPSPHYLALYQSKILKKYLKKLPSIRPAIPLNAAGNLGNVAKILSQLDDLVSSAQESNIKVAVAKSNTGKGMFANREIVAGELIAKFHGQEFTKHEDVPKQSRELYAVHLAEGKLVYIVPEAFPSSMNHSCDPNVILTEGLLYVALRDIAIGEELTFSYDYVKDAGDLSEFPEGESFKCLCGSANCRGTIDRFVIEPADYAANVEKIYSKIKVKR